MKSVYKVRIYSSKFRELKQILESMNCKVIMPIPQDDSAYTKCRVELSKYELLYLRLKISDGEFTEIHEGVHHPHDT